MRIINIEKRDIWVTIEFSAEQLLMLKNLLDHAQIEFDGEKEPEMIEAEKFLNEKFYPILKEFSQTVHKM